MRKLTKREKGFADGVLEGKTKRQAIKDNYALGSKGGDIEKQDQTADKMGQQTSNKLPVQAYLEDNAYDASTRVVELSKTAKNEATKLNANKDILDRAGYKPAEKTMNLNVNVQAIDPTDATILTSLKAIQDRLERDPTLE